MASAFAHALVAVTLGAVVQTKPMPLWGWLLGAFLAVAPDLDVVGLWIGIPYEHVLGHRGITHSIAFAAGLSTVATAAAFGKAEWKDRRIRLWFYLFLATALHGVLDAMTDGGLGVAFFAPFENSRYFFPFRPIAVSPLEPARLFTQQGWTIVISELTWIAVPCLALLGLFAVSRCKKN